LKLYLLQGVQNLHSAEIVMPIAGSSTAHCHGVAMNDKPVAGVVTALVAVPLALLCCLGPIALGSVLAGVAGWLGGLGVFAILGVVLTAAAAGYGLLRWRWARFRRAGGSEACNMVGGAGALREEADRAIPLPNQPPASNREAQRAPVTTSASR
jgi:hypothetical protein